MTKIQKDQISNSLVFTAMMMLMTALGIGGGIGTGIAISLIAIVFTASRLLSV